MTKHEVPRIGTPVQRLKHPTPAHIRHAIAEAISEDQKEHPNDMMPVRTWRVINDAITKACERHRAGVL